MSGRHRWAVIERTESTITIFSTHHTRVVADATAKRFRDQSVIRSKCVRNLKTQAVKYKLRPDLKMRAWEPDAYTLQPFGERPVDPELLVAFVSHDHQKVRDTIDPKYLHAHARAMRGLRAAIQKATGGRG